MQICITTTVRVDANLRARASGRRRGAAAGTLEGVSSSAVAEAAGHGVHLVLFGAGLVAVAVLLWVGRPRRGARDERARVRALRASVRAGALGTPGRRSGERPGTSGGLPE